MNKILDILQANYLQHRLVLVGSSRKVMQLLQLLNTKVVEEKPGFWDVWGYVLRN